VIRIGRATYGYCISQKSSSSMLSCWPRNCRYDIHVSTSHSGYIVEVEVTWRLTIAFQSVVRRWRITTWTLVSVCHALLTIINLFKVNCTAYRVKVVWRSNQHQLHQPVTVRALRRKTTKIAKQIFAAN